MAEKSLKSLLLRARYCTVCCTVKREGHVHKHRHGHPLRRLTQEEEANLERRWREEQASGAEAKKRRLAQDREEEDRRRRDAARPTDAIFRMDFGKHKGLTLDEVDRKDPSYLGHLVAQKVPQARLSLQQALKDTGRWDGLVANSGPLRRAAAERVLDRSSPSDAPKETRQLMLIQQEEARAVLAEAEEPCSPPPSNDIRPKAKLRRTASRARVQLSHCSVCGSNSHRAPTCPQRTAPSDAALRDAKDAALSKNRRKVRLTSRLKYTNVLQRTQAYRSKASQRSRTAVSRDFLTLSRMKPLELVQALIQDGLLRDLEGTSCTNPNCKQHQRFGKKAVLGPLVEGQTILEDISRRSLCYRCQACRARVTVNAGSPLFSSVGAGQHSMSMAVLAMWNCVQGISLTHSVLQLNINATVVGRRFGCIGKNFLLQALQHRSRALQL